MAAGPITSWQIDGETMETVAEWILESPLDCKEIWPVHPKGNQSWIFIGRTDAKAETPTLWPPDVKNWLLGKESDAGKDWRQEEKGMTENEIAGWHHQLSGHEFEQTPGDGEEQGSLACCSPWRHKSQTWLSSWTARLQEAWGYVLMVVKWLTSSICWGGGVF